MSSKRVLITGAGGFLGRNIVPLLLGREYDVTAVTLGKPPEELKNSCEWMDCNLLLPDSGKELISETNCFC